MTRPLCIYHGGCDDGFAAAFVIHLALKGEVDFHYGVYQQDPPDVTGRTVILVDFSYKRAELLEMAKRAKGIVVLDHHKSAAEDLVPGAYMEVAIFDCLTHGIRPTWDGVLDAMKADEACGRRNIYTHFDMNHSGAAIAWSVFFPGKKQPWLIDYIEDRDLWRRKLPDSDFVTMALRSYPKDFVTWTSILVCGPDALIAEGQAIHRYYRTIIDALKENVVRGRIYGWDVPIVNAPYHFASELAGELAVGEPFAACYWNHAHGTTYSLRSRGERAVDVSEIAAHFGGGGHKHAAGFTMPASVHTVLARIEEAG